MNKTFQTLLAALHESGAITPDQLIAALYVIRAHRKLTAIIPVAQEFIDLHDRHPEIQQCPEIEDYGKRIDILRRVATLDSDDPILTDRNFEKHDESTPLRPLTGDSSIADILLIKAAGDANHRARYDQIVAWFMWQAQRFHIDNVSPDRYAGYLTSDKMRLLDEPQAGRLYNAFLGVRSLADASAGDDVAKLADVGLPLTKQGSIELTLLARLNHLSAARSKRPLIAYAKSALNYTDDMLEQRCHALVGVMPDKLVLLLTTNWLPHLTKLVSRGSSAGGASGRTVSRPRVRRSRYLTERTSRISEDGVHSGTMVEIFLKPEPEKSVLEDQDEEDDDPDDREQTEPEVSLFLGDSQDLLKSFYGAKGMQSAIEYSNAMLAWPRWMLSREAIREVTGLVQFDEKENEVERLTRLAIGLSLITGRSLSQVAGLRIAEGWPSLDDDHPVGISVNRHCLVVRPAKPKLRKPAEMRSFCYLQAATITLSLPEDWRSLVQSLVNLSPHNKPTVARQARLFFDTIDPLYKVSLRGVEYALCRELAIRTRGDLGVLKAITDGSAANVENIVHYASYDAVEIEALWLAAVENLLDSMIDRSITLPDRSGSERVGAVHAFNMGQLHDYFETIRQRIQQAQESRQRIKAFNLLALYLSFWLGLATAGRKTRSPVPRVFLAGQWAVVADKSREDGSTDRVLPLTTRLLEQLNNYFALASELAIAHPALEPLVATDNGYEIRLQYVRDSGEVTPYRPKFQESHQALVALPGNWARKVVRSESSALCGRFRDAGMGHWTRGRHPWRITSSFNSARFGSEWLDLQRTLEQRLGFTPVALYGVKSTTRAVPKMPAPSRKTIDPAKKAKAAKLSREEGRALDDMLRTADKTRYNAVFEHDTPDPQAALDLVQRALKSNLQDSGKEHAALARALCDHVRKETKIPLFAMRPRPKFSQDWVIDTAALQTLAYVEASVMPAFKADLEYLPVPDMSEAGRKGDVRDQGVESDNKIKKGPKYQGQKIELGRLIMIAIWQMGLTRWPLIDALLKALHRGAPILATGHVRYIVLRAPAMSTDEVMRRTVVLNDFASSYLTVERSRLKTILDRFYEAPLKRRRAQASGRLSAYLKSLGVGHKRLNLTAMANAATQSLMLNASPSIAAYAAGKFYTQDLGDTDLRRLAGFAPVRRGLADSNTGRVIDSDEAPSMDEGIPADVRAHSNNMVTRLSSHSSPYRSEWRRLTLDFKPKDAAERLLKSFTLWLLEKSIAEGGGTKFKTRERNTLSSRIEIVGHAIHGFSKATSEWETIDEATLESLAELSSEHFPARASNGAWYQFYSFLRDGAADHAGFTIARLGNNNEHTVSAKILSATECKRIAQLLPSARSGIGNPNWRISAARQFDLMVTFGTRRAEAEKLRPIDVQGDLIRVQAYYDHTLKTAWSERVLPLAFVSEPTQTWISDAADSEQQRLIDPDVQTVADGNNFFDALNRVIKEVSQDQDLGSHHLRHTLASRVALSLLSEAVSLEAVFSDFPWLQDSIIEKERLDALLGFEENAGQGIQSLSAMMGHSHPTTTCRHYIHVFCILLYAHMQSGSPISMRRSFEKRIASRATVQRWAKRAVEQSQISADPAARLQALNRCLRTTIEAERNISGIHYEETALQTNPEPAVADTPAERLINFERIEGIDRSLREGQDLVDANLITQARKGLLELSQISSGKKGSLVPRHPMEMVGSDVFLPQRLAAGSSTKAAVGLCDWLEMLRENSAEDFRWLMDKWLRASESERGRIRVDSDEELARAKGITTTPDVRIEIEKAGVARKRQSATTKSVWRMRIRCIGQDNKSITRDTSAVRWVMSHVAALHLGQCSI